MSSTGRGSVRNAHDFYPTPGWCVRRLLEAFGAEDFKKMCTQTWIDPASGHGDIAEAVRGFALDKGLYPPTFTLNDPYAPDTARVDSKRDFLATTYTPQADIIFTNPPFSLATEFVEKALTCPGSLGLGARTFMLLRMAFLASAKRNELLQTTHPNVYVLPNRPSFTGKGTDSCDYAWFEWNPLKPTGMITVLNTTPLAERKNDPVTLRMQEQSC